MMLKQHGGIRQRPFDPDTDEAMQGAIGILVALGIALGLDMFESDEPQTYSRSTSGYSGLDLIGKAWMAINTMIGGIVSHAESFS